MNQFVLFKNASESLTAIPVEAVSRLELELILKAGGYVVEAQDIPVEVAYPRGTAFQYNALELSPSGQLATISI